MRHEVGLRRTFAVLTTIIALLPVAAPRAAEPADPDSAAAASERRPQPSDVGQRRGHRPLDDGERLYIVQRTLGGFAGARREYLRFDAIPDDAARQALRERGVLLMDYTGDNTYIAAIGERGWEHLHDADGIARMGAIPVEDKIESALLTGHVHPWARDEAGRVLVHVRFHGNATRAEALQVAADHGVSVLEDSAFDDHRVIEAAVESGSISALAGADAVRHVFMQPPGTIPTNAAAAALSKTDVLWNPPYDLDGAGYGVGVWDLGAIHPHPEFGNRITWANGTNYYEHATHIAGTVGAAGNLSSLDSFLSHGMASAVNMSSYDQPGYAAEFTQAINAGNLEISQNGWDYLIGWEFFPYCGNLQGCLPPVPAHWGEHPNAAAFGAYLNDSFLIDTAARMAETTGKVFLIVTSAGNHRDDPGPGVPHDGTHWYNPNENGAYSFYDCIGPLGTAKNNLTVGAVEVDPFSGEVGMTIYSGWGPANDGRVKPDLVAKGDHLFSPWDTSAYASQSGTSTAAAVVSGSAVLVLEQYEDTFGTTPRNAELKALLINAATDLGNPGPDYVYGFGLLQAHAAVTQILNDGASSAIHSGQISQGQTQTYAVSVPLGTPTLKVTLAWIDPPGGTGLLVNNLNLRLITPTGQSRFPFKLDVTNPVANATATGPNNVDTVEQVVVQNPQAGQWMVEVTAPTVPSGPQIYGLVSQNGLAAPEILGFLPPVTTSPFPFPYRRPILSAKYVDTGGGGINTSGVTAHLNGFNVTGTSVISSSGLYYAPTFNLWLGDFTFSVRVTNTIGVEQTEQVQFRVVEAGEVQGLHAAPGDGGAVVLDWGNSSHDPTQLVHQGYRIYRSTDLQANLEWIGETFEHTFTDTTPPPADLVFYEVHALYDVGSGNRILSIDNTPHRTQQPFIALPRPSVYQALPAGETEVRFLGMAEPGSLVSIVVDGSEIATTTTAVDGAFDVTHDFGAPGAHTVYVQTKAANESLSVPSVEVDFEIPPAQ